MSVVKNYLYNVGYQVFILLVPLITTPYITRVLGSEGVGINAFTNSNMQYFILLGSIGIGMYGNRTAAYVRDDKEKLSQTFWEITFLRLITITMAFAAFMVFLLFTKSYKQFYLLQSIQLISVIFDISWLFMGLEDFKKTVVRNFFVKIISVISIFAFVKTSNDVGTYILVLSLSTLIGNMSLWGYLKKIVYRPNFHNFSMRKHIMPSISLFIPQIAIQIYLVLNKTMLGVMVGVESSGYYENTDKIIKMVLAIVTATGTVMLPRMANTFAKNDIKKLHEYLYKSFDFVSFLSFPLAFGIAAISPKFAVWFMGDEFAITGTLIPVMSIVIIMIAWSNVLGTQYLIPTGRNKEFTISVTGGAIVNLLCNFVLISHFQTMGAVISTVISEIAVTIIQLAILHKVIELRKLFKGNYKYLIAGLVMYLVVSTLNSAQNGNFINFMVQIVLGVIVYLSMIIAQKAPIIGEIKNILKK